MDQFKGGGLTTDGNIRQRYFQQLKTSIDVPVVVVFFEYRECFPLKM